MFSHRAVLEALFAIAVDWCCSPCKSRKGNLGQRHGAQSRACDSNQCLFEARLVTIAGLPIYLSAARLFVCAVVSRPE
jgi:hypothetical protein